MADRQTRIIGGNGTDVQAFTLDPGLLQYVQSVFVTVDNSAGGDIQPTLTVQTNNGVALAKKQQGRSIPAGDSGSATWALRLDDESSSTPSGAADVQLLWEYTVPAGGQAVIDTDVDGSLAGLLPQTFRVLEVYGNGRFDDNTASHGGNITFNGDTGNHYDLITSLVRGTPAATTLSNQFNTGSFGFQMPAANAATGRSGSFALVIPNYASTLLDKAGTLQSYAGGGAGHVGTDAELLQLGFVWHAAVIAGIDQLTFRTLAGVNYVEGSYFAVYGRK